MPQSKTDRHRARSISKPSSHMNVALLRTCLGVWPTPLTLKQTSKSVVVRWTVEAKPTSQLQAATGLTRPGCCRAGCSCADVSTLTPNRHVSSDANVTASSCDWPYTPKTGAGALCQYLRKRHLKTPSEVLTQSRDEHRLWEHWRQPRAKIAASGFARPYLGALANEMPLF